MMLGQHT